MAYVFRRPPLTRRRKYYSLPFNDDSITLVGVAADTQFTIPSISISHETFPLSVESTTEVGTFFTTIDKTVDLEGLETFAHYGFIDVEYTANLTLLGQVITSDVGVITVDRTGETVLSGVSTTTELGTLSFELDKSISITGIEITSEFGVLPAERITLVDVIGVEVDSALSVPTVSVSHAPILSGQFATADVGEISPEFPINHIVMIGVSSTSEVGPLQRGKFYTLDSLMSTTEFTDFTLDKGIQLTGVEATAEYSDIPQVSVVVPNTRVFIISGTYQPVIAAGTTMYPTSEDIVLGDTSPYIIGASQYYTIGQVYWNNELKIEGVDWNFVTPGNHPTYTHIIQLVSPPTTGTIITLIYNAWNIQVNKNFIVSSYPTPFSFSGTSIISDSIPAPNEYYTVQFTADIMGSNPQSILARFPIIYDDMSKDHNEYTYNGFTYYLYVGFQFLDTTDFHLYVWYSDDDGYNEGWTDNGEISDGTTFFVKTLRSIYSYSEGAITLLYTVGDGASDISQVLTYPNNGEGVAYRLLTDGSLPNAPEDYPAAYQIYSNPGEYDVWSGY